MKRRGKKIPLARKAEFVRAYPDLFMYHPAEFAEAARKHFGYSAETYWRDIYDAFKRGLRRYAQGEVA